MSVITISRQSGSNGNEVAELICKRLGYRLFDKTLMLELANEINQEQQNNNEAEEDINKIGLMMERILNPFQSAFVAQHISRRDISFDAGYPLTNTQVRELILAAYEHDNVVIVGRGSQVVLADKENVLRVRVIAPLEKRIKKWQDRDGLSYKDAVKTVKERDRAHIDFVKHFFDVDLRDSSLYDLVINTEKFSPDTAVDVIIDALWHIQPPG